MFIEDAIFWVVPVGDGTYNVKDSRTQAIVNGVPFATRDEAVTDAITRNRTVAGL